MSEYRLLSGESFLDDRGSIRFFNSFEMLPIRRFYEICPANTSFFRGWQGHIFEKKWFYCQQGTISIHLIKVDNFEKPSNELLPEVIVLKAEIPQILEIPGGYVTGIQAIAENSRLMVFANFSLDESKSDDFRYPPTTWKIR